MANRHYRNTAYGRNTRAVPNRAPAGAHVRKKRSAFPKVLVALVVLALIAGAAAFCKGGETGGYRSPYTWSNLSWDDNGRPSYTENGQQASLLGIDVSAYDKIVDWQAVANDGINFAILRIGWRGYTEGGLYEDEYFALNAKNARAAQLQLGVYLFSSAITAEEAQEEAAFVIETLARENVQLDLPIVYDHEPVSSEDGRANNISDAQASACAEAFCEYVEQAGYQAMIYGNAGDLQRYDAALLAKYPVWLAEYDASQPSAQLDFCFWQFSSTGTVAGINRNVDVNIWFTDVLPLSKYEQ